MWRIITENRTNTCPNFRFALNSSVHETTGLTPAVLHLGRKLRHPMDSLLRGTNLLPDSAYYDDVQQKAEVSSKQANNGYLRNYNKGKRSAMYKPQGQSAGPKSSAVCHFLAKLALKMERAILGRTAIRACQFSGCEGGHWRGPVHCAWA